MKEKDIEKLLDIGIALSAEKDYNKLLEDILADGMSLTNCDAGTLYLREGDCLSFKIMRNDTMKSYQGGRGEKVMLPPVPISEENVCALALLRNRTIHVEDVRNCAEYDLSGPIRYDAMTGYRTKSMLVVPMNNRDGEAMGVLQFINAKDENGCVVGFRDDMEQIAKCLAGQAAVALENMRYVEEIRGLFHSFVQVLATAVDERTPYNATHTRNMVRYGTAFLDYLNKQREKGEEELYFTEREADELLMSVWLHDIGKLVTPLEVMNKATRLGSRIEMIRLRFEIIAKEIRIDNLLHGAGQEELENDLSEVRKALELVEKADTAGYLDDAMAEAVKELGKRTYRTGSGTEAFWLTKEELDCLTVRKGTLTLAERAIMENHVSITEKLLRQIHFSREYEDVTDWASEHHEYLNGTGYPRHLMGDAIPVQVRIITILDIFDALTASDRPYKPGMPAERAVKILTDMAEKEGKLDIKLTRAFIESRCWEG